MSFSRSIRGFLGFALIALSFGIANVEAGEISAGLMDDMAIASSGELLPVIVVMRDTPDYRALAVQVDGVTGPARRAQVVNRLRVESEQIQRDVLATLHQMEVEGEASSILGHWSASVVSGRLTSEAIRTISSRSDVQMVTSDKKVYMLDGEAPRAEVGQASTGSGTVAVVDPPVQDPDLAIAWGVDWIGAPTVWGMGYTGSGIIVAMLDTGVWYTHSDLAGNMWHNDDPWDGIDNDGNGYIDDYYGYDFQGNDRDPNDGHGHGTHTAGTVGGDGTAGTQTGVAPDVTLMACKVLDDGGYGSPSDVVEAIEYSIDNGASVMSLSIGWFDPDLLTRQMYRDACEGARLAGVTMCVAAGNERGWASPPAVIRTPGDVPAPWIHPDQTGTGGVGGVITIGATGYHVDSYAYFSSPGPCQWNISPYFDWVYPPGTIKPDVAAPGQNVNSTVRGGGYSGDTWSGTSMATPHVAGLVALMLSKNPTLLPAEVDQILETTALDRGPVGKDNDYGSGRVRAVDAINGTPDPTPDTTPPSAVSDLTTAPAPGLGRIKVLWTAPGDDGGLGTAFAYDIRYQKAALGPLDTEAEWSAASTPILTEPAPQTAGTPESWIFGGLQLGKQYWLAMKTVDEAGNWSGLSNTVLGRASGTAPRLGDPVGPDGGSATTGGEPVAGASSLEGQTAGEVFTTVRLAQNSPNPVLQGTPTSIQFGLPERTSVSLRVYTVTGQLVRVLADGDFAAGAHRVTWDGRDQRGSEVPGGVYFYTLKTGDETFTRKMAVMR